MTNPQGDTYVGRLVLGRYRILRLLAVGGMGRIYLARSEGAAGFVKPVVVKRVLPTLVGDDQMIKMFVREAKILASLRHPGIVAVSDFSREGDDYVMAMEYVHGYNLSRWLRHIRETKRQFPIESAVQVTVQLLDALHYAHTLTDEAGKTTAIVHRDVTPSNVLIDTEGHVKLLDFGIARSTQEHTEPDADGPKIKGKFPYIAPEVFGGAPPTPQSDVYSAGVLLHETILGRNELSGTDMQTTLFNAISLVPTALNKVRADVSKELAGVIAKGLSKSPAERYKSAQEFAAALRAARKLGSDEAREQLKRDAVVDFRDSDLAARQRIDDLATLEHAWRDHVVQSIPPPPRAREREDTHPTISAVQPAPVARSGPSPWALIALVAIVVVGGLGVGAWLYLRSKAPAPQAQYVFIQGSVTPNANGDSPLPTQGGPDATSGAVAQANNAGTSTPGPVVDAGATWGVPIQPRVHEGGSHPADPMGVLTRTFARQQSRITSCFEQNQAEITGNPELAVRFEIEADGHVSGAHLLPSSLESTAFASCILGVARHVNFGAQSGHLAFRIPITVRRVTQRH